MGDTSIDQLQSDLAFVKTAVQRKRQWTSSLAINSLWGVICMVGFSLSDFHPSIVPWWWAIAVPVGMAFTGLIAWRQNARMGEYDAQEVRKMWMHWVGLAISITLLYILVAAKATPGSALGLPCLILLGLAYYQAGVHWDRSYLIAGVIMWIGAVAFIFMHAYLQTLIGVSVCLALIIGALFRRPKGA